jgi:tetratricopeptide (TPR) repeat protein
VVRESSSLAAEQALPGYAMIDRSRPTLEELFRLLPPAVEETEAFWLRLSPRAVPDPAKAWAGSQEYATVDQRVVGWEDVDAVLGEVREGAVARLDAVLGSFREVFQAYRDGDAERAAGGLITLAEEEAAQGSLQRARHVFERALTLSLPLPEKGAQIRALRGIARVARAEGNLPEARLYYARSSELAAATGNLAAQITACIGVGNVYVLQGGWDEAETAYREALSIVERSETDCTLERAQIFVNLGTVATRRNRFTLAEGYFQEALVLLADVGSLSDVTACHHAMAVLRKREGRPELAQEHFEEALRQEPPLALRAIVEADLATFCLDRGQSATANDWARRAEEHAIASRSPYALCHMYRVLGSIARHREEPDGMIFFEKSLEIARDKGYPLHEAEALLEYGLLRHHTGNAEEAESFFDRAEAIFERLGAASDAARARAARRDLAPPPEVAAAS